MCGRRADIHYFMRWEKKRFNAYMRDIRLTLNISSHLLNARQAEKINRFKKSSSQSVKGISSTYALKSWRQKLVFGVCKKCHFLELFLCSQDIYLWCYLLLWCCHWSILLELFFTSHNPCLEPWLLLSVFCMTYFWPFERTWSVLDLKG